MSNPDVPGFGEGLETQAPLEEAPQESSDPDEAEHDPSGPDEAEHEGSDDGEQREPSEAEVLHDESPADEADDADEGGATADPAGPPA